MIYRCLAAHYKWTFEDIDLLTLPRLAVALDSMKEDSDELPGVEMSPEEVSNMIKKWKTEDGCI